MRLHGKLAIDHYIGGPLAWTLNIIAQVVAPFLRRDHSLTTAPRTVLFLKFIGLGSIVRASFLIASVRDRFPDAKIAFAVFPGCAPLVKLYEEVDEVVIVRDSSPFFLIVDTVKLLLWCVRSHVDLVIDLEVHAKYSALVSALSLSRDRAGFAGATSRFRRGLYTHLVFWNPMRFVDHAYEQLGAALGFSRGRIPEIQIPSTAITEADQFFQSLHVSNSTTLVGINPNASELRTERRWPAEHFGDLIATLHESVPDVRFLIVGAPSESDYCESVRLQAVSRSSSAHVDNIAGKVSFAAFLEVLRRLDVLVTNDSGPLHCARALGVKTVSLWGPTHPINYSPRGRDHISIYRPIYCSPCTHASDVPPCGGDNQCLKRIAPSRVAHAVLRLLGAKPSVASTSQREAEACGEYQGVYGYWQRESVPLSSRGAQRSGTARSTKEVSE